MVGASSVSVNAFPYAQAFPGEPPNNAGETRVSGRRNATVDGTVVIARAKSSFTGVPKTVEQLVAGTPPDTLAPTPRSASPVVAAADDDGASDDDTSISDLSLDVLGAGDADNKYHTPQPSIVANGVTVQGADGDVVEQADDHQADDAAVPAPAPKAAARNVAVLPASAFDGLRNLGYSRIVSIYSAKNEHDAADTVGLKNKVLDTFAKVASDRLAADSTSLLGRFLNFVVLKLRDNSADSQEAAKNFFHAVHDKGCPLSFMALREMVRPEERHHFKLETLEDHQSGRWRLRMLAGDLKLFESGELPAAHAARAAVEDAQRIAEISDKLGGRTPPVDAEAELRHIQETGDFRAFQALRARLAPADQALFKVEETTNGELWSYTLKIDGTELFVSRPLLDDTLMDAEKADLTRANPAQVETLHHKLENAVLAAKVARAISDRPRAGGALPNIAELEATERTVVAALDGKTTIWDKYAAIAELVIARTDPNKCCSRTLPVELVAGANAAYTLQVDGKPVYTAVAGNDGEHIAAATNQVAMSVKLAARSISEAHTVDNFRQANIQCMSDDPEVRDFIDKNLCTKTYSSNRFLRIDQPLDADRTETAEFSAVFRSDDGGETSITFSNRLSSRNEFRSTLLKKALADKSRSYGDLADLTAQGYKTPADSTLVYAITPVSIDIDTAARRLEDLGIDTKPRSAFRQSITAIKVTDQLTLGEVRPNTAGGPA